MSRVAYNLELNSGRLRSFWDERQWVVAYSCQRRPALHWAAS